jgi:hypothetical protein
MAILVDEQKANWKTLTGEPLAIPIKHIWALGGYSVAGISIPQFPFGMVTSDGPAVLPGNQVPVADPQKGK